MSLCWTDYNSLYVARNFGGGWEKPRVVLYDLCCRENVCAVDPTSSLLHTVVQVRRNGVTQNTSWDLAWLWE